MQRGASLHPICVGAVERVAFWMISTDQVSQYTDHYFLNARDACAHAQHNPRLLYQVFQRNDALLCGMKYVLRPFRDAPSNVQVLGLQDGDRIAPLEPVMHISGPAQELFALETVYLGLLARMTKVATNVRAAVDAAGGKPVLFFAGRFDVPEVQEYDGYAAKIGGAAGAATGAQAEGFGGEPVGTMPHALIAAFEGDTVRAALALAEARPQEEIWALADFENDNARTAVEVFRAFRERGLKLTGVRLDTSAELVDESVRRAGAESKGVNPLLVREVRRALNEAGGSAVKICASGGFHADRIREFEAVKAPVDVYAVGERFFQGSFPFTSDVVAYYRDGQLVPCAKVGRGLRESPRLERLR